MNFKWFGPIALLAALVIGDQIRINRPAHKYRLTVEVETPEGRKSASGVMAVHPDRSYTRRGQTRTLGDAVFVDLGNGKNLVALLAHIDKTVVLDDINYVALRAYTAAHGKRVSFNEMSRLTGIVPVKDALIPVLVSFADPASPGTAQAGRARRCRSGARQGLPPPGAHRRSGAERLLAARFRRCAGRAGYARNPGEIAMADWGRQFGCHGAPGGRLARGRRYRRPGGFHAKIAGQLRCCSADIDPPPSRRHYLLQSWPNPEDPCTG